MRVDYQTYSHSRHCAQRQATKVGHGNNVSLSTVLFVIVAVGLKPTVLKLDVTTHQSPC